MEVGIKALVFFFFVVHQVYISLPTYFLIYLGSS